MKLNSFTGLPNKIGLYDPVREKDSCGVGFIVSIDGINSRKILLDAKTMLIRMSHRGAIVGSTGDGAGVLTSIPHALFKNELKKVNVEIPERGKYAVGMIFMEKDASSVDAEKEFTQFADNCNLKVIHWRIVPVNSNAVGEVARSREPLIKQVFIVDNPEGRNNELRNLNFTKRCYLLKKRATHVVREDHELRFYICSLSAETITYKALATPVQLWDYYDDFFNEDFQVYLAIVHSRFSTNTFPSWERAQPFRVLAHNGEINTLHGNVNYMHAREGLMKSLEFGDYLNHICPAIEKDQSDSGSIDNVIEFLVQCGHRSLPEAMMTLVPEAWQDDDTMSDLKKAYYQWSSFAMEPWDGPALFTFTDGRYIGALLDRNGLRPSRYYLLKNNHLIMASEVGVVDVDGFEIAMKGRLKPGRMLLIDTLNREFTSDEKIKNEIFRLRPVQNWLSNIIYLKDFYTQYNSEKGKLKKFVPSVSDINEDRRLQLFGYNIEVVNLLLLPMLKESKEGGGSMGNDAPLACLSSHNPIIYDYFHQLFAQVTNPPIDPLREKMFMSLKCAIGPETNILEPSARQCQRLFLDHPILSLDDMNVIKTICFKDLKPKLIDLSVDIKDFHRCTDFLSAALNRICKECEEAVKEEYTILVLSDRNVGQDRLPVSAFLALGAVHQFLVDKRIRMKVALVVETAEAREVHHLCCLLGYGADAICPYLVFEIICTLNATNLLKTNLSNEKIFENYKVAVQAGITRVMAKMGICTLQSYKGAQIFEAVGIHEEVVKKCFSGTPSRLGGVTFQLISKEIHNRYLLAYGSNTSSSDDKLPVNPGLINWRRGGEKRINDPEAIASLQDASRSNSRAAYKKFSQYHTEATRHCTLRGQMEILYNEADKIDIDSVEPASEIVKRFATGAISFGSISIESHKTLAIAMNRISAKSNTGEGGEFIERLVDDENKEMSTRSAIKQIGSGRFGVTSVYLAHANDLEIKMALGAAPGEGGALPAYKVTEDVARSRNTIPGVGLISPPPHHDCYSIEDSAELFYDLKSANPKARISVKLVSEVGVGVIASGCAKAKAEHLTISGYDGGTGSSTWTGIKHAGLPWELGIAETHQTLVLNDLRSRVILQADGHIRTGLDVAIAALLGADEFGFATAPLITLGCIMMRKCHLNICPVGIASQDPVLREKFAGKPEHIINYLFLLAEEVRVIMAKLGFSKFNQMIGRVDKLGMRKDKLNEKQASLDFSLILTDIKKERVDVNMVGGSVKQNYELENRLEEKILAKCLEVINGRREEITLDMNITNKDRAFGSTLSYYISIKHQDKGLRKNSIKIFLKGHAGQSFGAFLARGIRLELEGDANDGVGKGLSGGTIVIYPPKSATYPTEHSIIVGNSVLYGAVSGKFFVRGQASERFCVRNSGAIAVSEGCDDHGCEYMTGGICIILGSTGNNFAAGMNGGLAYVYDPNNKFPSKCNRESVALERLEEEEDLQQVYELLIEFLAATGSKVAEYVLKNWLKETGKFYKVYPHEYRKVLEKLKEQDTQIFEDEIDEEETRKAVVEKKTVKENSVTDIEDSVKNIDKLRAFMNIDRETNSNRKVTERVKDWNEIHNHSQVRKNIKKQAARCMDCGVPFCQSKDGCPLGNIIPQWNELVFQDNWKEALEQLLQTNNFPEFTGRVCPAPCEGACVLSINSKSVTIKNIECAIIDHAFQQGWMKPVIPRKRTGKNIAIVGSGPAGLAAAAQLNKAGHTITVYERNNQIGGLLRYGIPTMKLSRETVQRRIDLLSAEGIIFETNVEVGKNLDPKLLLEQNDAVIMATGATCPKDLDIPGRELNGIHFAMSFLQSWQQQQQENKEPNYEKLQALVKNKRVIIIGGGDTAVDCIATALRQGAKDVTTLEIVRRLPDSRAPDNQWPTWPRVFKIDYGHEEAMHLLGKDPRINLISSQEFIGDENGNVCGIKTILVDWEKDNQGVYQSIEIPDSEKTYECDIVIIAMGFMGPEDLCIQQLGLKKDPKTNIRTPTGKYNTSIPKVYAAGDCRRGESLVVWAIHEGRQVARQVDYDLMGYSTLAGPGGVLMTQLKNDCLEKHEHGVLATKPN